MACFVPVLENTENTILVFFENCLCFLNLVFSMFFVYFRKAKEAETKLVFCIFFILLDFENKKRFSKNVNKQALSFWN